MQNRINLERFLEKGLVLNVGDVIFDSRTSKCIKMTEQTLCGFNKHFDDDEEIFIESFSWVQSYGVIEHSEGTLINRVRFIRYDYAELLKMQNEGVKVEDKKVYYTQEMFDNGTTAKEGMHCMWECGQHEDRKIKILAIAAGFHWILVDGHNLPDTIGNISGLYPIDQRTDEEKMIDEIDQLINSTFCSTRELACQLVETYTITKK